MTGDRALIVVDVQNDFCEGGSLPVEGGGAVAAAITEWLSEPERAGYAAVVATRDWHIDPGRHWAAPGTEPDMATSWPRHCEAETPGAEFHPDLAIIADEVFDKGRHSASYTGFDGVAVSDDTPLERWLRDRGISRVDVVGLATDHCVRATALDAAEAGFATRVLLDYCAGIDEATVAAACAELVDVGVELVG